MLQAAQFDVKTGKSVQVAIEGQWQPAIKEIEHSYLEHWCQSNNISTAGRFSVAQFYESVHDSDRRQLESEDKYLVFSNGSEGYFTDAETARLMTLGSETASPLYANDRESAHNSVAYGSLIASDGKASTTLSTARILVIDNTVERTENAAPIFGQDDQPISEEALQDLWDKLGDGTMLISAPIMDALITPEERDQVSLKAFEKAGITADITDLGKDLEKVERVSAATTAAVEHKLRHRADTAVHQFRAATPDLPGIAKGTMSYSDWTERLGVDAIISTDDIKGDDGRFSKPGIKEVSKFWVNRKATAQYGQQTVGPQVKYNIPEATQSEINPRVQEKAEQLAQVAGDFDSMRQRYLAHKENEISRPYQDGDDESFSKSRPDWLYSALNSDKYGQLNDQASVVRGLGYYVKGEWQRLSSNGTSVPSAMAQHHSKLKPWEVCNKDLPHGAIVAYYRSPFPNVGAAAIAINNTEIIKQQDSEAFSKQGVAYLPPDTAKNVAITDFDGDINGFFVGYEATVGDLPEQLREELADVDGLKPAQQYEYARAVFEEMIERQERGDDVSIEPSIHYPAAVKEFIQRTAPDVRPPQVIKQEKEKHSWKEGESHSVATWRAWGITSDNPTGKVATAGMSLQSLALELEYAPDVMKEQLLGQVSDHFSQVLRKADLPAEAKDKIYIPSDEWLALQGFDGLYRERLEDLAGASKELNECSVDPRQRNNFIEAACREASELLSEVATGPNAVNLQTAVDTAKSAKGYDEELHDFVESLQYKKDDFRLNKNNSSIYVGGTKMPTSVEEPVSWGIEQVNEQYSGAVLQERKHAAFQAVFPKGETAEQKDRVLAIIDTSSSLNAQSGNNRSRQRLRRSEDYRPTIQVTTKDGRQVTFQNVADAPGTFPWRSDGIHADWKIAITKNDKAKSAGERFPATLTLVDQQGRVQSNPMGFVDQSSVKHFELESADKFTTNKPLVIREPHFTTQVPWAQQNDSKMLYAQRDQYLEQALTPPEGKDPQVHAEDTAQALWRQSQGGRKLVMQHYPEVLSEQLKVFSTKLSQVENVSSLVNDGPRTVKFTTHDFVNKEQEHVMRNSVSIAESNGEFRHLGYIANDKQLTSSSGNTFMASFEPVFNKSGPAKQVVRLHLMDLPTIEQTPAELSAMAEGRRHITLDGEPHAMYCVHEGDIVVAQAEPGGEQIALQVKDQHVIDERVAAIGSQRWADAEKSSSSALFDKLTAARSEGKELWGLNVQPLGTYERGQIQPFELSIEEDQLASVAAIAQALQSNPIEKSDQLPELLAQEPASKSSGVFGAISRSNPNVRQRLKQANSEDAAERPDPSDRTSEKQQDAAPGAQKSKATSNQPPKPRTSPKHRSQSSSRRQKDGGIGY